MRSSPLPTARPKAGIARLTPLPALLALGLAGCGGGGGTDVSANGYGNGALQLSLTDAPACGYDNVFVTVEKVRIHASSTASDTESGWHEVVLETPKRVDLLTLTNGTLMPLGQTPLPAGKYTQMRLVLGSTPPAGSPAGTLANSIKPTGGVETALTTPSGQQSGLKMNINITVAPDTVADFAIDFNACKSFVKAGNSGQYLMKPVLSVIPIVSTSIVGYVDAALANNATAVSAQVGGVPVRATMPDVDGKFVLFPVPTGTYDLVISATGRVNAVMTGVPVTAAGITTIGSNTARINTPTSTNSYAASGTFSVTSGGVTSSANTGGSVRATQALTGGPTIEVGYVNADNTTGAYSLTLPAGAPAKLAYAAGATTFAFASDAADAGKYKLEAGATGFGAKFADIVLIAPVPTNFAFP